MANKLRQCDCGATPVCKAFWEGMFYIVRCDSCRCHTNTGNEEIVTRWWNEGEVHGGDLEHAGCSQEQLGYDK